MFGTMGISWGCMLRMGTATGINGGNQAVQWAPSMVAYLMWEFPSGYVKIAIENGHRNSEFSH